MIHFLSHSRRPDLFRRDPSFFYRCQNLADALSELGLETECRHRKHLRADAGHHTLVFHRPRATWTWRRWIKRHASIPGGLKIAEIDDLVFEPGMATHSPAVRNKHKSLWGTRRLFRGNRAALGRFRLITTSTAPLADHLRRCFPNTRVEVFPNCVPKSWRCLPMLPPTGHKSPSLTYFPGTRGHNADFAMISGAVQQFLLEHPEWHLLVVGPLDAELEVPQHQLRRLERVDFHRYHEIVRSGAINLAPLEDSPFNRCKSALKIMEAGFFGIPTVATPIPDAQRFSGEGVEFATTPNEWLDALRRLANSYPREPSWREQLRERIVLHASIEREAARWIGWLGLPPRAHQTSRHA